MLTVNPGIDGTGSYNFGVKQKMNMKPMNKRTTMSSTMPRDKAMKVPKRKGRLEEIWSRALHHDDPVHYSVIYRNFDQEVEVSLPEFIDTSENFQTIPATRILAVRKDGHTIYEARKKTVEKASTETFSE